MLRRPHRLQLQSTLVPTRRQRAVSAAVAALPSHWCTRTATAAAPAALDGAMETGGSHATVRPSAPPAGKPRARAAALSLPMCAPIRTARTHARTTCTRLRCGAGCSGGLGCAAGSVLTIVFLSTRQLWTAKSGAAFSLGGYRNPSAVGRAGVLVAVAITAAYGSVEFGANIRNRLAFSESISATAKCARGKVAELPFATGNAGDATTAVIGRFRSNATAAAIG